MAKEKIILLEGDNLIYTLGAISDSSNDVMTIEFPLYKSGGSSSFKQKDLVAQMFDKGYFNLLTRFEIRSVRDLKKLTQPAQPYKLKIGSSVRYENNSYEVIGLFYNTFAQQNIVSPILFNPTDLINDVKSLLFGLKENDEINQIINDNLNEGKYSNNVVFPFLASVTNYKNYLSNVVEPPFTTLDSIKVEQEKTSSGGDEIIPFEFPKFEIDFEKSIKEARLEYNRILELKKLYSENDFEDINANSFYEVFEKSKQFQFGQEIKINTDYSIKNDIKFNLPYNYTRSLDKIDEAKDLLFDTPQGKIPPLVKIVSSEIKKSISSNNLDNINERLIFGVLNNGNDNSSMSEAKFFYNILFQNETTYIGFEEEIKGTDFYSKIPSYSNSRIDKKSKILTLQEDSYYGDFFNSSGSSSMNSKNNNKILPFGSLVKLSGIWWYVIKYFATDINNIENLNKCFCIKATTRDNVLDFNLDFYSNTDKKNRIRVYDTEKIYKASIKNSHIFKFPPNFFSSPQKGLEIGNKSEIKSGLVTELFYEKRKEQVDLLKDNFPELSDSFFGILTVLDKKLRKPKDEITSINTENSIYCLMKVSHKKIYNNNSYDEKFRKKINEILEPEFTRKNMNLYNPQDKISKKLIDVALGSSVINLDSNDSYSGFYFSINTLEDYQKLYVTRTFFNFIQGVAIQNITIQHQKTEGFNESSKVKSNPLNTLSAFSKNYFLSSLQNVGFEYDYDGFLEIYNTKSTDLNTSFLNNITEKINYFKFSNYLFVYQVLRNLTQHIQEVALLHLTNNFEQKIKEHPLVKMYKNFDLNTEIGFFEDYHVRTNFPYTVKARILRFEEEKNNKIYDAFAESKSKLTREMIRFIFTSRWNDNLDFDSSDENERKEIIGIFLSFIKVLDTVYNFELDLTNKIKAKNNKFLEEFPIEPTDEDLSEDEFDDSDIFSEALEDLGDEFLEEIESVDITDF
jgi:hypothetical protein